MGVAEVVNVKGFNVKVGEGLVRLVLLLTVLLFLLDFGFTATFLVTLLLKAVWPNSAPATLNAKSIVSVF